MLSALAGSTGNAKAASTLLQAAGLAPAENIVGQPRRAIITPVGAGASPDWTGPQLKLFQPTGSCRFQLAGRDFLFLLSGTSFNKLIFDADGDGTISTAEAVTINSEPLLKPNTQNAGMQRFAPLKLRLPGTAAGEDYWGLLEVEQVTNWTLDGTKSNWQASFHSLGRREGRIDWNGQPILAGVQDWDSNGRFDDPFRLESSGDRLWLDLDGDNQFSPHEIIPFGQAIYLAGQIAAVTIAPAGAKLSLTHSMTPLGTLQTEESVTSLSLSSSKGFLRVPVQKGMAQVPQGKYNLLLWTALATGERGQTWELQAGNQRPPQLEVGTNTQKLPLLSSLRPVLSADRQNDGVRFSLTATTENGDTLLEFKGLSAAPQLKISSADGNPLVRLKLKPEGEGAFTVFWQPPADAPTEMRGRLEWDTGPFGAADTPEFELTMAPAAPITTPPTTEKP